MIYFEDNVYMWNMKMEEVKMKVNGLTVLSFSDIKTNRYVYILFNMLLNKITSKIYTYYYKCYTVDSTCMVT